MSIEDVDRFQQEEYRIVRVTMDIAIENCGIPPENVIVVEPPAWILASEYVEMRIVPKEA